MASPTSSSPIPPSTPNAPNTKSQTIPTQKLTALSRFKSFTGAFGSKKPKDTIVFPPPSWFITDEETISNDPQVEHVESTNISTASEHPDNPEPLTLAQKIKTLIDALPLPAAFTPAPTPDGQGVDGKSEHPEVNEIAAIPMDDEGPPVPVGVDAKLMRLLSSEDVMNGDTNSSGNERKDDGPGRQSVWSMLDRLRHGQNPLAKEIGSDDTKGEGVMLYSPLEPKSDSQVELADSELEYIDVEDFRSGKFPNEDQGKGKGAEAAPPPVSNQPVLEKRWVPSTTKLSLYTTWWGYRLYLPPPVMATLGDGHLKATKRAAMITTALQWFLNKIPLKLMPPQVRGAAILLRRLLPLAGYIGVFVAWSWGRISACNKGNGVVLTATWLLPVALIPMAWDAGAIHGPSMPPPSDNGGNTATMRDGVNGSEEVDNSKKPRK